jgi:hypothetical protein
MSANTIRSRSLVVRTYAPWRRAIIISAAALLTLFVLYVVYEWGRYDAGYDRMAVRQERVEHEVAVERLEKANRELRTRLAELDTVRIGRAREQAEVARTIGDLQAQVARQTQELAFYRGIVTQGASPGVGIKIQQTRISPGEEAGQFHVRLALVRTGRPDDIMSGSLRLSVDGETGGVSTTLTLAELTGGKIRERPISFRYFENFEQEIALPSGFRAERLTVEVRPARKGSQPLTQTFLWRVD